IAGNFAAGVSRTVFARGLVVEDANQMRLWNDYRFPLNPRPSPLTGTSADSAVIGTGVARVLQLCGPLQVKNCPQPRATSASTGKTLPTDIAALAAAEQPGSTGGDARIELLAATAGGAPNVAASNSMRASPPVEPGCSAAASAAMSVGSVFPVLALVARGCGQFFTCSGPHSCSTRATPVPITAESALVPVNGDGRGLSGKR